MSKNTKAIVENIYPLVKKSIQSNEKKYKNVVSNYFSRRSSEINDIGPMGRIYFGSEDLYEYFKALNIKEPDIKIALSKTYYANMSSFNPQAAKDPFTCTQLMVIRYYVLNNKDKEAELASIYLAFSGKFYPSLHYKYFPKVQPSEYRHVMEYAINNELSQKFDLKREGSLFKAVASMCRTWLSSYESKFKSSNDEDCVYLIQQLHNRFSSFMKNIAEVYYRVYDDKDKYLTYDSNNYSDDNFHIADSNSLKVSKYIENTMNYIQTNTINYSYCKLSSDATVKVNELKTILETIQDDKDNLPLIRELVSCIIIDYVNYHPNDSNLENITGFLVYSITFKPNSKDPNVKRKEEIIEQFLNENSPVYRKRKSNTTKNSYRKAIVQYYSLIISQVNK